MRAESQIRRYLILGFAVFAAIFCFSISVYWMARADSANKFEAGATELMRRGNDDDTHLFNQCAGYASDVSYVELNDICGADHLECRKDFNTRWTTVFEFNGVILFFLSLSYAGVAVGAFIYRARVYGAACTVFWNCCHLIALIVTAAYRFNKWGRLCALSQAPSSYQGDGRFSEWTFADDGRVMTDLWGLQLLTFVFIFCIGV